MKFLLRGTLLIFVLVTAFFILLASCLYYSYNISRSAAEELVGDTLNHYQLSQARMELAPLKRKIIVWSFKFSYPDVPDEEFYIYTNLSGIVVLTNPTDLKNRLEESQKIGIHPYDEGQYKIMIDLPRSRSKGRKK